MYGEQHSCKACISKIERSLPMIHKNKIKNFTLHALNDAKFVKTALAKYEQNGISKTWEVVQAHDSVAVLIYHDEKNVFVFIGQFRPAVDIYNNEGMSIEL